MAELLPLFPLQLVVFPGMRVPLHIFEERYKLMVAESLAGVREFGIVLAQKQGILNAGCSVSVETVLTTYSDGRLDIITAGQRRFEVLDVHHDKPYLVGTVEFFGDEDEDLVPASLRLEAVHLYRQLRDTGMVKQEPPADATNPRLSFVLGEGTENLEIQSALLRERSEGGRLRQLVTYLRHQIPQAQQASRMKQLAPKNGFSALPADL